MATLKKTQIGFKTNYRLMQVKSIAECSKASFSYHFIKIFVLYILSGPFTQISESMVQPYCYVQLEFLLKEFLSGNTTAKFTQILFVIV